MDFLSLGFWILNRGFVDFVSYIFILYFFIRALQAVKALAVRAMKKGCKSLAVRAMKKGCKSLAVRAMKKGCKSLAVRAMKLYLIFLYFFIFL